jgi:hypothetical protein
MVGVELKRGMGGDEEERQRNGIVYSPLGNMLSIKRQRFKAQPHARLGYPTKCHDTYPHSEGGLIETEGGESHFQRINQMTTLRYRNS